MKKLKITIVFILMLITSFNIFNVYASNEEIELIGKKEVEAGELETLEIKISSDRTIGVVEGTITFDSNIENITVEPTYNGWTTTYNESTGQFNSYSTTGIKNGEVIKITYKAKEQLLNGKVTLNDIKLTTIDYDTIDLPGEKVKDITLKMNSSLGNNTNNAVNNTLNNVINNTSNNLVNNTSNNVVNNSSNIVNNVTNNKVNKVNDVSTANKIIPATGISKIVPTLLVVLIVVGIIMYKKFSNY